VAFSDFDIDPELIHNLQHQLRCVVVRDLQIKLEKRKQTATLQLSTKKRSAPRKRLLGRSDTNRPLLFKPTQLSHSYSTLPKPSNQSLARRSFSLGREEPDSPEEQDIISLRSSRNNPIQLSSSFVPEIGNTPPHTRKNISPTP
jgi:hypothetical protein